MRTLVAVVLMLASCADVDYETFAYECKLIRTCGDTGSFTRVPFVGTVDEVRAFAAEWSDACTAITSPDVFENRCDYVLCGVICTPKEP